MEQPIRRPRVGVGVMILKDGKVLLGHRNADAEKASSALHGEGTWTMPGGKLDFHEDLEDAICRDVLEETNLTINKEKLKVISVTNEVVPDAHFVTIGFLSEDVTGELKTMEPEEITEWKWFPIDALHTPMYPTSAKMVRNFLAKDLRNVH